MWVAWTTFIILLSVLTLDLLMYLQRSSLTVWDRMTVVVASLSGLTLSPLREHVAISVSVPKCITQHPYGIYNGLALIWHLVMPKYLRPGHLWATALQSEPLIFYLCHLFEQARTGLHRQVVKTDTLFLDSPKKRILWYIFSPPLR